MRAVKAMVDRITSGASRLAAPLGLTVTSTTDSSVSLSWNEVSGAAGYNVYRSGAKANASPVDRTTFTDSALSSGTEYHYTVRATTSAGAEGPASSEVSAKTTGQPPVVPPPTNLTVRVVTNTTIGLSWNAAAGVAGYDVYRLSGAEPPIKVNSNLITGTDYTVASLTSGTRYTLSVRSEDRTGASSVDSNRVTATTSSTAACFTASNFAHVQAGRAHDSRGYALANGSNEKMGLDNIFLITTLKQSGANFYVIDQLTCP